MTSIIVDATRIQGPVKDIYGTIMREPYFLPNDPLRPNQTNRLSGSRVARLQELAPIISGKRLVMRGVSAPAGGPGTYDGNNAEGGGDGGHWRRLNPSYPQFFDPNWWGSNLKSFMYYCTQLLPLNPILVVNFGSSNSEMARKMVAYLNGTDPADPDVALRIQHGRSAPYNVVNFEIGNENYGSWETGYNAAQAYSFANPNATPNYDWPVSPFGDQPWWTKPAADSTYFGQRVAEYARKMRAASPFPINIYASLDDWGLGYRRETGIKAFISQCGEDIDGVIFHFYPNNGYWGSVNADLLGRVEAFPQANGTPESLAGFIDLARTYMAQARAAKGWAPKEYKIGITEYNNASSSNPQTLTLTNGLFVANFLALCARRGIDIATYTFLSIGVASSGFTLFTQDDNTRPMPTFYALKLFTQHFGDRVILTNLQDIPIITAGSGTRGAFRYNALQVVASLAPDNSKLYLLVVNNDLVNPITADVSFLGFGYNKAQVWELNGPTPDSTNITLNPDGTLPVGITGPTDVTLSPYTFPAHSATVIELSGGGPPPPPPTYVLGIDTDPSGIPLKLDGVDVPTPASWDVSPGTHTIEAPASYIFGGRLYSFRQWENGSTNPVRALNVQSSMTVLAQFTPVYALSLASDPPGIALAVDGVSYLTPTTFGLAAGLHTIETLGQVSLAGVMYQFVAWEDGTITPQRIIDLAGDAALTATYVPLWSLVLSTDPSGVPITVDGVATSTPATIPLEVGLHTLEAPLTVSIGNKGYQFTSWENGSANPIRSVDLQGDMVIIASYLEVFPPSPPEGLTPGVVAAATGIAIAIALIIKEATKK